MYIKKLIANVNIGLLEKSYDKKQKSYIFEDLSELKHYQAKFGGNINVLTQYETKEIHETATHNPLDAGVDDDMPVHSVKYDHTKIEKEYYVLSVSDQAVLRNGFRYIKELVLQNHNYFMYYI
jgi:hypothetical protein